MVCARSVPRRTAGGAGTDVARGRGGGRRTTLCCSRIPPGVGRTSGRRRGPALGPWVRPGRRWAGSGARPRRRGLGLDLDLGVDPRCGRRTGGAGPGTRWRRRRAAGPRLVLGPVLARVGVLLRVDGPVRAARRPIPAAALPARLEGIVGGLVIRRRGEGRLASRPGASAGPRAATRARTRLTAPARRRSRTCGIAARPLGPPPARPLLGPRTVRTRSLRPCRASRRPALAGGSGWGSSCRGSGRRAIRPTWIRPTWIRPSTTLRCRAHCRRLDRASDRDLRLRSRIRRSACRRDRLDTGMHRASPGRGPGPPPTVAPSGGSSRDDREGGSGRRSSRRQPGSRGIARSRRRPRCRGDTAWRGADRPASRRRARHPAPARASDTDPWSPVSHHRADRGRRPGERSLAAAVNATR